MKTTDYEQMDILTVEDLTIFFKADHNKKVKAVHGIDFHIKSGETLAVVGESGCGKSVTSLSIMGLIPKNVGDVEGNIRFKNIEVSALSESELRNLRGKDLAMIFQEPMTSLNPVHTIGKQLDEVFKLHTSLSKAERRDKTIDILKKVGISRAEQIIREYPHQLSGGMRQRVMIAMAMALNPTLLIADEPTTALDVTIQAQILELMNELKAASQTAILLITHDLGVVAEMADRVMVMYYGQVVEEAPVEELFDNPKHPYTVGLLNSLPSLEDVQERLEPIEGNVPNIGDVTKGCSFASRCKFVEQRCLDDNPPLVENGPQHKVRCWIYGEGCEQ